MEHDVITGNIIGCAMKVHAVLGSGFPEVIYQRALAIEFRKQNIGFIKEMDMPIFYDGIKIGSRRVDFFVENNIMLELKAVVQLDDRHLAQAINYLEAYNLPTELLIILEVEASHSKEFTIQNTLKILITNRLKNDLFFICKPIPV